MTPTDSVPATAWHALGTAAAVEQLGVDTTRGLSREAARERLARYGRNAVETRRRGAWIGLLVGQINNPIVYLLLGSTALALLMGKVLDGLVVAAAAVLNAAIGFFQEFKAGKAVEALSRMVPNQALVIRDGQQESLPSAELVPGDVLLVASGDRVPADARLLEVRQLRVDESALTGESVPAGKDPAVLPDATALGDRRNMLFGGTLVTSGTGRALVVGTGLHTELGRISGMLESVVSLETPLTRAMAGVGRSLTWAVLAVAAVLWGVGLLRGYSLADATLAAITLAVGAIPEGLPAIITIALAIGVRRMARRGAVVRRLPSVETLGSTTVVCSDKTGTLTRNEMTVQALETLAQSFEVSGVGYAPRGSITVSGSAAPAGPPPELLALLEAGALASDACLREAGGAFVVVGDPTEGALVVVAAKAGIDVERLRRERPRLDAVPFESERQFMATLHAGAPDGMRRLLIKGAPEVVLRRVQLGPDQRELIECRMRELAARGLRLLAMAEKRLCGDGALQDGDLERDFALLGLAGMIDPPRPEAIAAITECRRAVSYTHLTLPTN